MRITFVFAPLPLLIPLFLFFCINAEINTSPNLNIFFDKTPYKQTLHDSWSITKGSAYKRTIFYCLNTVQLYFFNPPCPQCHYLKTVLLINIQSPQFCYICHFRQIRQFFLLLFHLLLWQTVDFGKYRFSGIPK